MLRMMFALVALVSLIAMAACNSNVSGVAVDREDAARDGERYDHEMAPARDELVEPDEGGGGGGGSEQRPNATENRHRRGREEIAP